MTPIKKEIKQKKYKLQNSSLYISRLYFFKKKGVWENKITLLQGEL